MGLDVTFYEVKRKEIGYFRKRNFFLTYFHIEEEQNTVDVEITKDMLAEFVADLKCELVQYKERIKNQTDEMIEVVEIEPINPRLRTKEVFFGGSTAYYPEYWEDLKEAYCWASEQLKTFDWDNSSMVIHCWW